MVGGALDGAKGVSEVNDGTVPIPESDFYRFCHSRREGRVRRRAIFPANLVCKRLSRGEVVLNATSRRRSQSNISGMNIYM